MKSKKQKKRPDWQHKPTFQTMVFKEKTGLRIVERWLLFMGKVQLLALSCQSRYAASY
jgi:hypothetical protein